MIQVGRYIKPHRVIILGDLIDCYALSKFLQDPILRLCFQGEVDASKEGLALIRRAFPKALIDLEEGNHEQRLRKTLWTKVAELANVKGMNIETLLELDKFKIRYHSPGVMEYKDYMIIHGKKVRSGAGNSVRAEVVANGKSTIMGHIHRLGEVNLSNRAQSLKGIEGGTLSRYDLPYLDGEMPDWQHGFVVGWADSSHLYPTTVKIEEDGKVVFQNKTF